MSKISELSDGGALQSTDYLIAVRSGGNVKVQPAGMTFSSVTITSSDINGGTIDGVTIGGSSAGAGSFTTLTASGDVNVDSGTLFVDVSANNVGINTTSPNTALDVIGTTTSGIRLKSQESASNGFNIYNDSSSDLAYLMNYYNGSMIFGVNNTEQMRLTSSGLQVGTTDIDLGYTDGDSGVVLNPDGFIQAARDSGFSILYLNKLNNDGKIIQMSKDGTEVGSIGVATGPVAYMVFNDTTSDNVAALKGAGGAILPSTNAGADKDGTMNLGSSGARFENLYLSGGVYLGGTAAANLLDDYEEGTWTPTLLGTTANPTITYTTQYGRYTKIGRIVYCEFDIQMSAKSGGSGDAYIAGLPFTKSSADPKFAGDMAMLRGGRSTALDSTFRQYVFSGTVLGNDTAFELSYTNTSGVATAYTNSDISTGRIVGSFQYIAA